MAIFSKADINIDKANKDGSNIGMPILGKPPLWSPNPGQYGDMIAAAAKKWGVPVDLAIRQAGKESGYLQDIISGKRKSSAGATGLFQFMPATAAAFKLDPTDPEESANIAMMYMAKLYKQFGDWKKAAWAYNWGEGNLRKYLRGEKSLPKETRIYGLVLVDGYSPTEALALLPSIK